MNFNEPLVSLGSIKGIGTSSNSAGIRFIRAAAAYRVIAEQQHAARSFGWWWLELCPHAKDGVSFGRKAVMWFRVPRAAFEWYGTVDGMVKACTNRSGCGVVISTTAITVMATARTDRIEHGRLFWRSSIIFGDGAVCIRMLKEGRDT